MGIEIRLDDLRGPEIAGFLEEHLADMRATSPPESIHALDLDGLRHPSITFWTVWDGTRLAGSFALKELGMRHGELKSMRVAREYRGTGMANRMMEHLLGEARERGMERLSLETGSMPFFEPARRLYRRHGFEACGPFGAYREDPNSVFMTLELRRG